MSSSNIIIDPSYNNLSTFQSAVLLQSLPGLTNTGLDVRTLNSDPNTCIKGDTLKIITYFSDKDGKDSIISDFPSTSQSQGEAPVWSGFRIKLTEKIEIGYWHMHYFTRTPLNRIPANKHLIVQLPTKELGARFMLNELYLLPCFDDEVGSTTLPQNFTPLTYWVCQATEDTTTTQTGMFYQIPREIFYTDDSGAISELDFYDYVSRDPSKLIFNTGSLPSKSSVYDLYIIGRSIDV